MQFKGEKAAADSGVYNNNNINNNNNNTSNNNNNISNNNNKNKFNNNNNDNINNNNNKCIFKIDIIFLTHCKKLYLDKDCVVFLAVNDLWSDNHDLSSLTVDGKCT